MNRWDCAGLGETRGGEQSDRDRRRVCIAGARPLRAALPAGSRLERVRAGMEGRVGRPKRRYSSTTRARGVWSCHGSSFVCSSAMQEAWLRLKASSDAEWPGKAHPTSEAVETVLEATGEHLKRLRLRASRRRSTRSIALRGRAGVSAEDPLGFTDRHGVRHLPFRTALALARRFAAAEPRSVLIAVESEEPHYELELMEPHNRDLVPLVNKWRASWALCRQWAGHNKELATREAEIERLRRVVSDVLDELRRVGADDAVRRIERRFRW